jgi:hypothetical protein
MNKMNGNQDPVSFVSVPDSIHCRDGHGDTSDTTEMAAQVAG